MSGTVGYWPNNWLYNVWIQQTQTAATTSVISPIPQAITTQTQNGLASAIQYAQYALAMQNAEQALWLSTSTGQGAYYLPALAQPGMAAARRERIEALHRPAIIHAGRRALRRSIDLYRRVRGPAEINAFLRGEHVTLRGHRFSYRVLKRDDLIRNAERPDSPHIPYVLKFLSPANGEPIAQGCIVIRETPAIDQLLALALSVQDPEQEIAVVRRTHWHPELPREVHAALAA
jgi:hypothetical protein